MLNHENVELLGKLVEEHVERAPLSVPASARRLYQWLRFFNLDVHITYELTEKVIDWLQQERGYIRHWVGNEGLYFVKRKGGNNG